ncbi:hypothetical protein PP836_002671 [Salmonella enterica]|nr:hypothetical protein [Salmonella enterica subsp. diarizonae]EGV3635461.1 hypothetical protein [Salmonella enterica]EKL0442669.1 hypothetical protein [Salmonella enterica]HCM1889065.1 hypothetical protein [Salmonella enterica subsp. diarizonae serovar 57:c:z]
MNDIKPTEIEAQELAREVFRQRCAKVIRSEDEGASLADLQYRNRRTTAELMMLASYLDGQTLNEVGVLSMELCASSLRDAIKDHGRKLIDEQITLRSGGEPITPEMQASILHTLLSEEEEYSPYHAVLVDMLDDVGMMEGAEA